MNSIRQFYHLLISQEKLEEDQRLYEISRIQKETEMTRRYTEDLIRLKEIQHQTDMKGKDQELAQLQFEYKMYTHYHENELRQLDHEKEMMGIVHKNESILSEIDHSIKVKSLEEDIYKRDHELKQREYMIEQVHERLSLLKEQNVLEGKKGQVKDEIMTLMKSMIEGRERDLESKRDLFEIDNKNKMGRLELKERENAVEDYYLGVKRDMLNTDVEKKRQELRDIAFNNESRNKETEISLSKQSSELWVEHNRTLMEKDRIELEGERQKLDERYLKYKDEEVTNKSKLFSARNKLLKEEGNYMTRNLQETEEALYQLKSEYSSLKTEEKDIEESLKYLRKEHSEAVQMLREARNSE